MSDRQSWQGERGTRHARGYGSRWDKLRIRILERDLYLCQPCKRDGRLTPLGVRLYDHAVDHVVPKSQGGTDDPDNLEAICSACHDVKSAREAKEAQGSTVKPRVEYDADGWPVWDR